MGLFARNQITWDNRPKCPPIEDCGAKNARTSMPTRKQQQRRRVSPASSKQQGRRPGLRRRTVRRNRSRSGAVGRSQVATTRSRKGAGAGEHRGR